MRLGTGKTTIPKINLSLVIEITHDTVLKFQSDMATRAKVIAQKPDGSNNDND
jgi:hypothetical protein